MLAYTEKGKDYAIRELGQDPKKILVVRNTIEVKNSSMSSAERRYFLYVGRIQKRKNVENFIRQLPFLGLKGEVLRIVGDGEYKTELIKLVKKLDLIEQVNFFPGTYDETILKSHFSSSIAYVSPSQLGLGIVHSFAYGIPVFADKTGKHGPEFEYCNDLNSILYNGDDELLPTLKTLLTNPQISISKGKEAYNFFVDNLQTDTMKRSFYKAINL